jgi:hypothetical protein
MTIGYQNMQQVATATTPGLQSAADHVKTAALADPGAFDRAYAVMKANCDPTKINCLQDIGFLASARTHALSTATDGVMSYPWAPVPNMRGGGYRSASGWTALPNTQLLKYTRTTAWFLAVECMVLSSGTGQFAITDSGFNYYVKCRYSGASVLLDRQGTTIIDSGITIADGMHVFCLYDDLTTFTVWVDGVSVISTPHINKPNDAVTSFADVNEGGAGCGISQVFAGYLR